MQNESSLEGRMESSSLKVVTSRPPEKANELSGGGCIYLLYKDFD